MNHRNPHQFRAVHKMLFIVIALLTGSMITFGQTNVAIAPIKMNVLYIGVDNPVSVAASGGTDDKITVSVSGGGGMLSKIGTGLYNVRVAAVTNECLMNVYVDGKLAGTSRFRVRSLPIPSGTIGGFKSDDNITADYFRTQIGVGTYIMDSPFEVRYEVLGFTFSVDDDKGGVKSAECQGNLFSSQARQYIDQYVKPGRTVTINNIRAKDPGGRELKLPSLVYYIK
jgi:hypothetical protein